MLNNYRLLITIHGYMLQRGEWRARLGGGERKIGKFAYVYQLDNYISVKIESRCLVEAKNLYQISSKLGSYKCGPTWSRLC